MHEQLRLEADRVQTVLHRDQLALRNRVRVHEGEAAEKKREESMLNMLNTEKGFFRIVFPIGSPSFPLSLFNLRALSL